MAGKEGVRENERYGDGRVERLRIYVSYQGLYDQGVPKEQASQFVHNVTKILTDDCA